VIIFFAFSISLGRKYLKPFRFGHSALSRTLRMKLFRTLSFLPFESISLNSGTPMALSGLPSFFFGAGFAGVFAGGAFALGGRNAHWFF
jgi:hypothetical protein